ncbi:nucleotidyltransferase substrate binding protein [Novosphingobium sp. B 225]|uniref:nucleotidyltransferase substrate binding protein n=1 Tax=Novosphingobium sp. B 225 TaxID=1961849 RepID=UPI000B4A9DF1|nr:nucleotidyltransferase substrate binding protein [Novosphingobium sp. B 225]
MALDFSSLAKAVARLDEGLARYQAELNDDQIRDGLIQRFEFTYDLSHRMLRRALEQASANPEEVDRMGFPDLIRTASEQGLVQGDWTAWRSYREMRNITSHSYDEAKALQVAAAIPAFLAEARALLQNLVRSAAA